MVPEVEEALPSPVGLLHRKELLRGLTQEFIECLIGSGPPPSRLVLLCSLDVKGIDGLGKILGSAAKRLFLSTS